MRRIAFVVGLVSSLAMAACMGPLDNVQSDEESLSGNPVTGLPVCHLIDGRLRGREAIVYKVTGVDNLLAVAVDGDIVCVDTTAETLQLGLIAVSASSDDSDPCKGTGYCDGTPLPAAAFNDASRRHAYRSQF